MKQLLIFFTLFTGIGLSAQLRDMAFVALPPKPIVLKSFPTVSSSLYVNNDFTDFNLLNVVANGNITKKTLGYSKKGTPVEAWYFPGKSDKRAMVIGGVHGSELSAIDVVKKVIEQLQKGDKPYYNVIVIPVLFPDNAKTAEGCRHNRVQYNTGRYTAAGATDPNRQLPPLSKPFNLKNPVDAYGRPVENENALLLQLLQAFAPERIVTLHAIKDTAKAGIYADPRTDCEGKALGFGSDSALALLMAKYIDQNGGRVTGNALNNSPAALYYLDPKAVSINHYQPRNLQGMNATGKIAGVSLGSWASTAVCDEANDYSRPAIRLLTVEFPGYKRPTDYAEEVNKHRVAKEITLYAEAVCCYFLEAYCTDAKAEEESLVIR